MSIQRHILHDEIVAYLDRPEKILCIEGVRQTGKTTAIEIAVKGRSHVLITMTDETFPVKNLASTDDFKTFESYLRRDFGFVPDGKQILVIDEAQKFKKLYGFLMQMNRLWKNVPVILSGSVMGAFFYEQETEKSVSPAGRVQRKICRPFSFYEFLDLVNEHALLEELHAFDFSRAIPDHMHRHALSLWRDYLVCGGMPEAIRRRESTKDLYEYFQNLLAFFWQDADRYISEMSGDRKTQFGSLFRTVLEAIARLTCQPTTRSSILSSDSPAYRTVLPLLLNAAEGWHFIFRLTSKMKSMTTKQGTSSKKYLWDVGVMNHLLNASRPIPPDDQRGLLPLALENFVAQELVFYLGHKDRLFSWKSSQKQPKEMDFMAQFVDRDVGIEVKSSHQTNFKAISQLQIFSKIHPQASLAVVYLGVFQTITHNGHRIHLIPPYLLGALGTTNPGG